MLSTSPIKLAVVRATTFLVMAILAAPALAWNSTGHMAVALVAYRRLDDHQKQQIAELLTHHPHYQLYLSERIPAGVDKNEWAFLRSATWPDYVRPAYPGRPPKPPSVTKYNQSAWHYINLYFVPPVDATKFSATSLPARAEPNIITAGEENLKKLSESDLPAEDKAVALCWVIHLIGDVHQPLHTCSMASTTYPKGDLGGNEFTIRYHGKPTKLHAFWDDVLGTSDTYKVVSQVVDRIADSPGNDVTKMPEAKERTTFGSWVDESHDLAVTFGYLEGNLEGKPWADVMAKKVTEDQVPPLPGGYEASARALAERRVALAGFRLAEQLNTVFKP
jgi:hypothetical protein